MHRQGATLNTPPISSSNPKMGSTILVLFLFISYAGAISTSDFQIFSTSESRALNHSNVQTHQAFLERLSYGSMKDKNRLGEKVEERKNEISDTLRKAHGSGGRGAPSGSGSANINRRPPTRNSATSLLQATSLWGSYFTLSVASFALIFVFLFC